jgi:hypothetical protein
MAHLDTDTVILQAKPAKKADPQVELIRNPAVWTNGQKIAFRIAFVFFIIMSVPNTWQWYTNFFTIDYAHFQWRILYEIANFSPNFYRLSTESGRWGAASYLNWLIIFGVSAVLGLIWTVFASKTRKQYNVLYYWLGVIVRYRVAVGIIAFGFIKFFPTQMPFPSLTVMNTNFGDLMTEKLYWASVGVVPKYEIFLGVAEVLGGVLLFFRKTTFLGAAFIAGICFNIAWANHAYDGGVHVYSGYLALLSLFILASDLPAIWNLLVRERDTVPVVFHPIYKKQWQRNTSYAIKFGIVAVYTLVFFYYRLQNHLYLHYDKEPATPGLSQAKGYYNVSDFKVNGKSIPYSPLDSIRWHDVVFEKWSTFTYKTTAPVKIDLSNGSSQKKDIDRNYEVSGSAGGRRFFFYKDDAANHILYMEDKNRGSDEEGGRRGARNSASNNKPKKGKKGAKKKSEATYVFHYTRPTDSRIILQGVNEKKDSIYVVLDRVNKKYPLLEGRRTAQTFIP